MRFEQTEPVQEGSPRSRAHGAARRGVASMLVIVTVAVVTVMTLAFLHGQKTTPDVSTNVAEAARGRYLAESGADLAAALMQVEDLDWRTAHTEGVLLNNYNFAGGAVSIKIFDLAGNPPTASTEYAVVRSTGAAGALRQAAVADVYAPKRPRGGADIDLSEFAIFSSGKILIDNGRITRWYQSPRARLGMPIRIGTNSIASGNIDIRVGSRMIDSIACAQQQASISLVSNASSFEMSRVNLTIDEPLPIPLAPTPSVLGMKWALNPIPTIGSSQTITLTDDRRYSMFKVDAGAVYQTTTSGHRVILIDGMLEITNNSSWIVDGSLDLIVLGDVLIHHESGLVVPEGSRLRLFAGGNVTVDHSALGFSWPEVSSYVDPQYGTDFYRDPRAIQVFRLTQLISMGNGDYDTADIVSFMDYMTRPWNIMNGAYVCGRLYGARTTNVLVDGASGVFGSMIGTTVTVRNGSALHYDHRFDDRLGYTNPDTSLYVAPMDLDDTLAGMATDLNDSTLNSIAAYVGGYDSGLTAETVSTRDRFRVAFYKLRQVGVRPIQDADPVAEEVAPRSIAAATN